jgi:hypothetical protein
MQEMQMKDNVKEISLLQKKVTLESVLDLEMIDMVIDQAIQRPVEFRLGLRDRLITQVVEIVTIETPQQIDKEELVDLNNKSSINLKIQENLTWVNL